ncbi:hypothetical protein MICAD_70008 [Microcystis aeruginosa PCC 7941]|nr:hypothetical protein MICAD_70008 [Microcystis aeruginosa PCC 7941]
MLLHCPTLLGGGAACDLREKVGTLKKMRIAVKGNVDFTSGNVNFILW